MQRSLTHLHQELHFTQLFALDIDLNLIFALLCAGCVCIFWLDLLLFKFSLVYDVILFICKYIDFISLTIDCGCLLSPIYHLCVNACMQTRFPRCLKMIKFEY